MIFEPAPPNIFREFIATYFERCRAAAPEIEGIGGKWAFEDLIPGLSDFDTRFFTRDGLTTADWSRLSMTVAAVHLELARERPEWARILEHLPGVNLTWPELFDPSGYFCEFRQWTLYAGPPEMLAQADNAFGRGGWSEADEVYHWKRIATYYDRYSRTIDPPINLGRFESKYPLHSRVMHYLAPPIHSAVSLFDRSTKPGKLAAFQRAREIFPRPDVMDRCIDLIEAHYERPEIYAEPNLTAFEDDLEDYLTNTVRTVMDACPLPGFSGEISPASVRRATADLAPPSITGAFFESARFSRLMQGRLWFFSHEIPWFDSIPLIRIELNRIGTNFLAVPLRLFGEIRWGHRLTWHEVLDRLHGDVFSEAEIKLLRHFHALADSSIPVESYRPRAAEIAAIYPDFLTCLNRLHLALDAAAD